MDSGPGQLKLQDDDTLLEASVWAAELGAYEWDLNADTVRWLNSWCQHHDIDPCDGPAHSVRWRARVHPEDRAAAMREFDAHLAGTRDRYECEYRVQRPADHAGAR
jgi:PAS domain-containing protein